MIFPYLSIALPMAARGFPSNWLCCCGKPRKDKAASCDLAASKHLQHAAPGSHHTPRLPGGQCDPCPAASCDCLGEQSLPRTIHPTLKSLSVVSTWEAAERCSKHRLDGSAGCPAPQLSSLGLPDRTSRAKRQLEWLLLFLPKEPSPYPLLGRFCWLQNQDGLRKTRDTVNELAEGSWWHRRSQRVGRPSKMTFLQPDSSNVIIPTNYFHDLI